jgi:hypothetical protein
MRGLLANTASGGPAASVRDLGDYVLAARIFALAAVVPLLARLRLPWLQMVLEPRHAPAAPNLPEVQRVVALVTMVLQRGQPVVRRGCLTRGVTLYYFLRRAGLDVALVFGLGRTETGFAGHCWLIREGAPYLEPQRAAPSFTEIYRIEPRARTRLVCGG